MSERDGEREDTVRTKDLRERKPLKFEWHLDILEKLATQLPRLGGPPAPD